MEFEFTLDVAASPTRIWSVLTGFSGYPQWHPFVRIDGEGAPGSTVRYTLRKNEKARGRTAEATITTFEPCNELVITFGVKPFMTLVETYKMDATDGGSSVFHGFRCEGLLPLIAGQARMEKRLMPLLILPLKRLEQRLKASPADPREVAPVSRRKGFRQPKKRR